MSRKNPDENEAAARLVREATRDVDELPADVEARWMDWSRRIQATDERTRSLCRAAFEVGVEAANAGRVKGGRAGGKARAAKLSKERRAEIASEAAKASWKARRKGR